MRLEVISPTATIFNADIDELVLETELGQIGVLPGHARLLCTALPGTATIRRNGKSEALSVKDGFLEVDNDRLTLFQKGL